MQQTSVIAFGLIVGFIVFITVRGELPSYLCVLGLGSNCPHFGATPTTAGGAPLPNAPVLNAGLPSIPGIGSPSISIGV